MPIRYVVAGTAALALLATPLMAQTTNQTAKEQTSKAQIGKSSKRVETAAQTFVTKAANGGLLEVESSQIAAGKSRDEAIRTFAQQMVDDHRKANADLEEVGTRVGAKVPAKMDRAHQAQVDKVRKATDATFDKAYIDLQVKAHRDAVTLFRTYAKSGRNPELKTFASRTLPTLEQHQTMAADLQKASSATGRSPGASGKSGSTGTAGRAGAPPTSSAPAPRDPARPGSTTPQR